MPYIKIETSGCPRGTELLIDNEMVAELDSSDSTSQCVRSGRHAVQLVYRGSMMRGRYGTNDNFSNQVWVNCDVDDVNILFTQSMFGKIKGRRA